MQNDKCLLRHFPGALPVALEFFDKCPQWGEIRDYKTLLPRQIFATITDIISEMCKTYQIRLLGGLNNVVIS